MRGARTGGRHDGIGRAVAPDPRVVRARLRRQFRHPHGVALEKIKKGPNLVLTVIPNGPWSMRQSLTLWFLYAVVVGAGAWYVAGRPLPPGAGFGRVFRLASVAAFLGSAA